MKIFKLECWYRSNDEKDFYHVEIEAEHIFEAVAKAKQDDRRIFKIEVL